LKAGYAQGGEKLDDGIQEYPLLVYNQTLNLTYESTGILEFHSIAPTRSHISAVDYVFPHKKKSLTQKRAVAVCCVIVLQSARNWPGDETYVKAGICGVDTSCFVYGVAHAHNARPTPEYVFD
jgi:hypothetical protein